MARSWSLAEVALGVAGKAQRGGPHRLVARLPRLFGRAGAKGGGESGPNPTDRGKSGTKRHVVVDRQGVPLAVTLSPANVHDSRMMLETVDAIAPIKGRRGRPRRRPAKLHADKAAGGVARRGVDSGERLGRHRWVVERTLAWLNRYRRLRSALYNQAAGGSFKYLVAHIVPPKIGKWRW